MQDTQERHLECRQEITKVGEIFDLLDRVDILHTEVERNPVGTNIVEG